MIIPLAIDDFVPTADKCILDVRDIDKFADGHIAYAKNYPIDSTDDATLLSAIDTYSEVFVLCGGGTKAVRASERLEHLNPNLKIIHLTGGTRQAQALGWELLTEK